MTKRMPAVLLLLLALAPLLRADWKSELLSRLGRTPDYRAAYDYLVEESKKMEPEDKQTASVLLPFLAGKLGDVIRERDLAVEYFETYRDYDPDFGFLDDYTLRDFIAFWARWKNSYPLAYDLNLLSYAKGPATGLPATVEVGLELLNPAFYRISLGPYILEGGHWPAGFHILTIPLNGLFERSDTYDIILDLRAGDIIVRKPVRVRIDIADMVAGAAPSPRDAFFPKSGTPAKPIPEGEISLYVDGKLILRSRKIAAKPSSFSFPLGGPLMPGQKPYLPPPKTGPMASGVNIVDAIALAYKAIKDLVAKKPPKPSPPSYQKVSSLSFAYSRTTADGLGVSARASIDLVPARAFVLKE
ncbi:MAG TPA: hypothetical protein VMY15_04620 [Candidatus Latescibacteria bacterium]|nr:hypothetical protein [Candidatus Latescibacterota bacterium]